jgi:2,4-dienoyl-CoA reductase-like NADH-dependent reductase (Old Yellow Enzyme family)
MPHQPILFTPLKLRTLELRNRVFVSPMCQYSCRDGFATEWHLVHLGSRAVGGAGLVMVEATAVTPDGRISPADMGLWSNDHVAALARIAAFVKAQGAAAGLQLAHAGRKASTSKPWEGGRGLATGDGGWVPVAPSAIAFADGFPTPRELTVAELDDLVERFADAARRALDAGFDLVELHAAHGYLLHEFLSPLANRRTDRYGGSFDGRVAFPLAVARRVREVWPGALPVFVRVSATDWAEGGWTLADTIEFGRRLKAAGIDLVDCSSGGMLPAASIPLGPGYQVRFAEAVRREAGIATGAVGMITSPEQAEQIVATGQADAVFLAREMLRQPYWPLHAARVLGAAVEWPTQYLRAKPAG